MGAVLLQRVCWTTSPRCCRGQVGAAHGLASGFAAVLALERCNPPCVCSGRFAVCAACQPGRRECAACRGSTSQLRPALQLPTGIWRVCVRPFGLKRTSLGRPPHHELLPLMSTLMCLAALSRSGLCPAYGGPCTRQAHQHRHGRDQHVARRRPGLVRCRPHPNSQHAGGPAEGGPRLANAFLACGTLSAFTQAGRLAG